MKHNEVRLYNVIFPVWLLWFIPVTWIVVLPANFVIDLLVLTLTLKHIGVVNRKQIGKNCILRVWICGFLSDIIGSVCMFMPTLLDIDTDFINSVNMNPFENIGSVIYVTICLLVSAACIYFLNLKFCLNKSGLEFEQKKKIALSLAVFTAPYLFYLPTEWFY